MNYGYHQIPWLVAKQKLKDPPTSKDISSGGHVGEEPRLGVKYLEYLSIYFLAQR